MGVLGGFVGGLGYAYEGARQGEQDVIDRQNAAAAQAALQQQRVYDQDVRQHTMDAMQRQDDLRTSNQNMPGLGSPADGSQPPAPNQPAANQPAVDPGSAPTAADASDSPAPVSAGTSVPANAPTPPSPGPDGSPPAPVSAPGATPVPAPGATPPIPGASSGASSSSGRLVTQDAVLRNTANNVLRTTGDTGQYIALNAQADQIAMARSAKEFMQVKSASAGKTPYQIAQDLQNVYNNDPMPGQVTNVEDAGGGAARVTVKNTQTGVSRTQVFQKPDDILSAMESVYSPDSYRANAAAMYAAHVKVIEKQQEEQAKGIKLRSGEEYIPGVGDPRTPQTNTNWKPSAAGAGKPVDPDPNFTDAKKQYDVVAEKLSDKFTPDQAAAGKALLQPIMDTYKARTGQVMPAATAVDVATRYALHPEQMKAEIDPSTGTFVGTMSDSQGNNFLLPIKPQIDPKTNLPAGLQPADAKAKVGDMLASFGTNAPVYQAAAFDPSTRASLINQARAATQTKMAAISGYANAPQDQKKVMLTKAFQQSDQLVQNRLKLISLFGDAPTPAQAPRTLSLPSLIKPGGLPGGLPSGGGLASLTTPDNSISARYAAQRAAKAPAPAAAPDNSALSAQFASDQQSMQPVDFVRKYDGLRGNLSPDDARTLNDMISRI